jgi:pimeloyl-ACP methyl ester carboxylesterase
MSAQIQIASVAGRDVRFLEGGARGAADVLVLAHAFPVGPRLFEPQLEALAGWRVIAPAMAGFEGSDALARPSADAYAEEVAALLDRLGVSRAVFGGVSMGGHVVYAMLRLAPERVRGIILADTRSTADPEDAKAGRRKLLQVLEQQGVTAVADDMLPKLLGPTTRASRPDIVARVRALIESQPPAAIAGAIDVLMNRPDSTPMLPGIRVPALVVVGEEDALSPPAEMRRLAAALPDARVVELPGCGHLANLEDPRAFNAAAAEWLSALGSRLEGP